MECGHAGRRGLGGRAALLRAHPRLPPPFFSQSVGALQDGDARKLLAGSQNLNFRRDGMEVRGGWRRVGGGGTMKRNNAKRSRFSPPHTRTHQVTPCFGEDGSYADWDAVNALWEHAFT